MELREADAARQPPMSSTDDASASDDTEDIRTRRRALPLAHCGRAGANLALETFEYRPEELLIMAYYGTGTGSREAHLERVAQNPTGGGEEVPSSPSEEGRVKWCEAEHC